MSTQFGANDPRTQAKWSRKMFEYAIQELWLTQHGFIGTGPNSIIQQLTELDGKRVAGSKVTVEMEVPLQGAGQGDDGDTTGKEEALTVLNQTVEIHERAHSVVSAGKMSEKRTSTDIREAGKRQLGIWQAQKLENDLMAALYGLYNESGISVVNESAPSSARIYFGGQTAAGAVSDALTSDATLSAATTANYLCGLQLLDVMKRKAKLCTPKIVPLRVKGYPKPIYVVLLHEYQIKAIQLQTGTNSYQTLMAQAQRRGEDNPLFAGAEFLWNGMLVYDYERAPMRTGAGGVTPAEGFVLHSGKTYTTDPVADGISVARGLLLGRQAGMLVWGQKPGWYEDKKDARLPKIVIDELLATAKTKFNEYTQPSGGNTAQQDFGVYAFDTQVIVD